MASPTRHLIELSLKGRTLNALVRSGRRTGRSWQSITDEIRDQTGINVSRETVRGWFPELSEAGGKASA